MPDLGVVIASPTGLVKGLDLRERSLVSLCSYGTKQISTLSWDVPESDEQSFLMGTKNGSIIRQNIHNISHSSEFNFSDGEVVSLLPNNKHILGIFYDGVIRCFRGENFETQSKLIAPGTICCGHSESSFVAVGGKACNLHIWDLEHSQNPIFIAKNVRPTTLQLEVPVWISDIRFVPQYNGRIVLTASRIGELYLYDTRCGQRRPVSRHAWRMSRKYGKIKVGKAAHGAVLPDLSVTRPITRALAFDDAPGSGIRVVAGNVIGDLCFLDMRLPKQPVVVLSGEDDETTHKPGLLKSYGARAAEAPLGVQTLPGASGSITGLVCGGAGIANFPMARNSATFNNEPVLIASSLDRYVRFYNRDTGVRLAKFYAKVPIRSFLISDSASFRNVSSLSANSTQQPAEDDAEAVVESSESEDEEFDELWDQMETVSDHPEDEKSSNRVPTKRAKRKRRS